MAKILFCWELGAGLGHLLPYRDVIKGLQRHGHEIWFASRSLQHAEQVFAGMGVNLCQSPLNVPLSPGESVAVHSFAQVLHNTLAYDVSALTASLKAWRTLIELIRPDMLIADHSPGAMLASRDVTCQRLVSGSGFLLPPVSDPWPCYPHVTAIDNNELQLFEKNLLLTVNSALDAAGISPLKTLGETLLADDEILMTYPELDQYMPRADAQYRGITHCQGGYVPEWPVAAGKRVFAYLKDFDSMPALIETLAESGQPALLRMNGGNEERYQQFESDSLRLVTQTVDLQTVLAQADLYISNANHASTAESLLLGTPVLCVPLHLEQFILARNVELLGAGLSAPLRKPQGMASKFNALLTNPAYTQVAQNFAKKYAGNLVADDLADHLNGMLAHQRLH